MEILVTLKPARMTQRCTPKMPANCYDSGLLTGLKTFHIQDIVVHFESGETIP